MTAPRHAPLRQRERTPDVTTCSPHRLVSAVRAPATQKESKAESMERRHPMSDRLLPSFKKLRHEKLGVGSEWLGKLGAGYPRSRALVLL
ncbi:uncharacterized protein TNIN_416061 [Trichonephila inaurata madagascariensis]|uniref:Uncharacterized protein n=1 Tax=Trichonephila inaurata madagascariensis TaxID=2747483 RepID=A0A8X6Y7U0_9ARAC|nr:uncharacterized protein TNIN_416061 [Trichonephila inaurata madagascariensis]